MGDLWQAHEESDHDLSAIIIEQRSIIPTLEPCPVPSQGIGEENPPLTIDIKLDDLGTSELFLFSSRLVSLLGHQFAWGKVAASLGICPVFNWARSFRSEGSC